MSGRKALPNSPKGSDGNRIDHEGFGWALTKIREWRGAVENRTKIDDQLLGGVAPVRWTVNCFRDRHRALSEGGTEVASPVTIVDPEGTVRSLVPRDRS